MIGKPVRLESSFNAHFIAIIAKLSPMDVIKEARRPISSELRFWLINNAMSLARISNSQEDISDKHIKSPIYNMSDFFIMIVNSIEFTIIIKDLLNIPQKISKEIFAGEHLLAF